MIEKRERLIANVLVDGRIGGPQRRVVQVAKVLKKFGWKTMVVFPSMGEELPKYLAENGLPFEKVALSRIRRKHKLFSLIKYLFVLPYQVYLLIRLFNIYNVDLVHANSMFALHAVIAARLCGRPVVWHFNDMALPRLFCVLLTATIGRSANIRAYSCPRVKYYQREFSQLNSALLYPPVDLERFNPSTNILEDKNKWPELVRQNGELLLISVGNINPLKGYHNLIEALATLKKHPLLWRMIIVGAKLTTAEDYFFSLQARIKELGMTDRYQFLGSIDDIPSVLSICDIFVLSSHSESGPMVLLEAMAAGKPIIASDVGFVPELITNNHNGLIVPPNDIPALSKALKKMISNESFRSSISDQSRTSIAHKFTVDGAAEAHNSVYNRLLKFQDK